MPAAKQSATVQSCPRCAGPMYMDYDGDQCCMYCGQMVYAKKPSAEAAGWSDLVASARRKVPRESNGSTAA